MTTRTLTHEPISNEHPAVSRLNVPNILCAMRLFGSPILVALAIVNQPQIFLALLVFLLFTDWIDGKLAILWKQQTTFGARFDSIADVSMYAALLFGAVWLKGDVMRSEASWLMVAIATYALTTAIGFAKFGRIPSYHTRAAKTCWLLTSIAAIALFAGWSVWPLRIAAAGVALTNVEAIAITYVLPQWKADVTSVYHAWRDTRGRSQRPAA